ncbi:MAG: hypothetical protein WD825_15490, partial [Gemmatimonadaceae bacterium]
MRSASPFTRVANVQQVQYAAGARARTAQDSAAVAQFQAGNPRRHVGQAHSMALNEFYHEFATTSKGKPCQAIRGAWAKTTQRLRSAQPALDFGRDEPGHHRHDHGRALIALTNGQLKVVDKDGK